MCSGSSYGNPAPSLNSTQLWSPEQCVKNIQDLFDSDKTIHSCYLCSKKGCTNTCTKSKFQHAWLSAKNWWLLYIENEGMYCIVCKKHNMKHPNNQRETFSGTPSVRFKVDALNTHSKCKLHSAAIESEMLQEVSYFHQEVTKKREVESSVLQMVFSSAYFLMKEFIANKKLLPLLDFMQKTCDVEALRYFNHRSARCQMEIFSTIGQTVKKEIIKKAQKAQAFGLMTDEATDISVTENLVTYIQFYCQDTGKVETFFLSCQDVLKKHRSANSEAITSLILEELKNCELDTKKLTGLVTDGASVMVGKRSGVATRLKEENPLLINIHCICHRLALSCTDTNESIKYIKTVETILRQLWQFFENSPKRMAAYLKVQTDMKNIMLGEEAKKSVGKRLKKACRTRWLSFQAAVDAIVSDYESVLQTLSQMDDDATACGLLKKMRSFQFLGALYILKDILPILAQLSKYFQKDVISFSAINPAVKMTKDKIKEIQETEEPLEKLKVDADSFTNMCGDIKWNVRDSEYLHKLLTNYTNALIENIDARFNDSMKLLSAFQILDPTLVPLPDDIGFKEYGKQAILVIAKHFYPKEGKDEVETDKLKIEWEKMKYYVAEVVLPNMPDEVKSNCTSTTPTDWFIDHLLKPQMKHFYPQLAYIAEVVSALPVSNAWPERGASTLKTIKTKQRNRLSQSMLEYLMQVSINGPPCEEAEDTIIKESVNVWCASRNRRRLPKKSSNDNLAHLTEPNSESDVTYTSEIGVQTNPVILADNISDLKNQVQYAVKMLNLDASACNYSDSNSSDED